MPVRVYIEPFGGQYRATCRTFGFEVVAESKAEASTKINSMIREHVAELKRTGRLPERKDAVSCTTKTPTCSNRGCSRRRPAS